MAVDLTKLEIRIQSLEAKQGAKNLDGLGKSAMRTEKATAGLTAAFLRLAGPVALVAAGVKGLTETVRVTREFDILGASLITATGSAEDAELAFSALQALAQETPYDLQQVTSAFVTLVNRGLDPSERAMRSYGDTAAALGGQLEEFIRAVAQGTVNEFESLKTFGVRAKNQGDTIAFTFRGVTETVRNNAQDIERYLIELGEINFAGAMEKRMETLDGAISNLGDEWDKLVRDVSKAGLGSVIESSVRGGIEALEFLGIQVRALAGMETLADVERNIKSAADELTVAEATVASLKASVTDGWVVPQSLAKVVSTIRGIEDSIEQSEIASATAEVTRLKAALAELQDQRDLLEKAKDSEDVLARYRAVSSGDTSQYDALVRSLMTEEEAIKASYDDRLNVVKARLSSINNAIKISEAALQEEITDEQRKSIEARIAGFKDEKEGVLSEQADLIHRIEIAYAEARATDIVNLQADLMTQAEMYRAAYNERQDIIDRDNTLTDEKRNELTRRNQMRFDEETQALVDAETRRQFKLDEARVAATASLQSLTDRLMTESEAYLFHYDYVAQAEREHQRLLDEIRTNAYLTEQQRNDAYLKEEVRFQEARRNAAIQSDTMRLHSASATAQSLGQIAEGMFGEQSKAARVMFAINKGFTIAQGSLATLGAIGEAMKMPFPANIPLIAQATAQGASLMANIRGVEYSGAYDAGGFIPAGKWGIAGEIGPEVVEGPARITSRRETAALARQAMSGGGGKSVSIGTLLKIEWAGGTNENPDEFAYKVVNILKSEMRTNGALEALAS
ncbi:tape measure protein [Kordiimonas sp.]|uniref:tape measure protein n=1 Tax=Kordiimonas sp. TaxID=1970157 RepID=UPI003B524767